MFSTCLGVLTAMAVGAPAAAFELSRVRLLDGPFRVIQELHRQGLLGQLDPDRLLYPFRRCAGLPQPAGITAGYGGWDDGFISGHYAGHYLTAASRMAAATGDATLRERAEAMVRVLAECQARLGGGYLSAFPAERLDRLEATPRAASVDYYTIHKILAGLVDVARHHHNDQALEVAGRLADYVAGRMARLSPEQIEALCRTDYTGNPTNEFGGMAEALADLALLARERGLADADRHLKLAAVFCRDWFVDPLARGEDRLDGLHGNSHIAQAAGLARYSLATGDERMGRAAAAFWRLVVEQRSFVNGGNAFAEKLRAAGTEVAGTGMAMLTPLTAEYCNTNNMLKLTRSLFERAPAAALGDYAEGALYNHILAAIAPDTGQVMYHMSMRPGDFRVHIDEPYCCQGTGLENAARFGESIYFGRDDALWVNQYIASTLDWREQGLRLRLDTRYPEDGLVRLTIEAGQPRLATIHLRIPGWLQGTAVARINGQPVADRPAPGTFLALARTWLDGDVIELRLPLGLRQRVSRDDPTMVSFFHGPLLLAGALGRDGMPVSDTGAHLAFSDAPPFPVPVIVAETPTRASAAVTPVDGVPATYMAHLTRWADRQPTTVALKPFYQVQHQRYAVYWKALAASDLASYAVAQATLAGASSFVGDADAERSRHVQGEQTRTGSHAGRRWRDAIQGGWFSYRLPLPGAGAALLVCTYWGGETGNRVFDILVDDQQIATQTLAQNQPGGFYAVAYRLPDALTRGKQFVVVRFQAHPGAQAGGVFDVRLTAAP
ncbi:MAG: glycoside hydrolase family 127 protein [Armatimonadetes bacterium]|nr:glycoside hydrolase family 127 protein [Armatimonadota bacterium]